MVLGGVNGTASGERLVVSIITEVPALGIGVGLTGTFIRLLRTVNLPDPSTLILYGRLSYLLVLGKPVSTS